MASRIRESEIERVARAAQERGMSYGKFVSLGLELPEETRRAPKQDESREPESGRRKCANDLCQKPLETANPRQKYCCKKCWNQHYWNQKKREEKDV